MSFDEIRKTRRVRLFHGCGIYKTRRVRGMALGGRCKTRRVRLFHGCGMYKTRRVRGMALGGRCKTRRIRLFHGCGMYRTQRVYMSLCRAHKNTPSKRPSEGGRESCHWSWTGIRHPWDGVLWGVCHTPLPCYPKNMLPLGLAIGWHVQTAAPCQHFTA